YEKGRIFQTRVEGDDWAGAVKRSLRYGSRRLFMGELREPESVKQLIRMGLSNTTVLATVHAANAGDAIASIQHYIGDDTIARNNFASSFSGVIIQKLEVTDRMKRPVITSCLMRHEKNSEEIRIAIASANGAKINELIEQDYKGNILQAIEAYDKRNPNAFPKPSPNDNR
ncbi:MAG: Flp pilus assembly complex ATPase component TadA, partial [Azospirillum sp.]|nr:Flp pilus assembly complex ATPase component TadA [Azospirillum sp.]